MRRVANQIERTSSELAEQLRRWIVVGGYLLGGWSLLQSILMFSVWGLPFNRHFLIEILTPIHRLATALWLVAPPLLVIGCWRFQQHRRWARPALLTAAGVWIGGVFGIHVVDFIAFLSAPHRSFTSGEILSLAAGRLDLAVYSSVFSVSIILCLTRREVRDEFPEFRAGFTPVFKGEAD
jgi:hypothetical protein